MGQSRITVRRIPTWAATVQAMKESDCQVLASCMRCGYVRKPLPLDPITEKFGPDFCLFDRWPRCRVPGCTGRIRFMYSPGAGTPFIPCRTRDLDPLFPC